jgi:hypothetical protein
MLCAVEGLDDDGVGRVQVDALARGEHAVFAVLAGQPDAAGDHAELADAVADAASLAGKEALGECVQG